MNITNLPKETIEEILIRCHPLSVAALSQCCRDFATVVYHSGPHLWRSVYLGEGLDDPRLCVSHIGEPYRLPIDWKRELQDAITAQTVIRNRLDRTAYQRSAILRTLFKLISHVPPSRKGSGEYDPPQNYSWVKELMEETGWAWIDDEVASRHWEISQEELQLRKKLHVHIGMRGFDWLPLARLKSRAYVYDMRNYGWATDFGPFNEDGGQSVNWVHMHALHRTMSWLIEESSDGVKAPLVLESTQPSIPLSRDRTEEDAEVEDWVGLNGTWIVSFAFCDHRLLLRYNDPEVKPGDPLDVSILEGDSFLEVFRSLKVNLQVSKTVPDPDHPTRPKIYFIGAMTNPSSSTMNGWVQMTPDGHIRWHFTSGDSGNAVWSSEGVQVGGIGSSYGVLGAWTTVFHNITDPIGPFWLRKATEEDELAFGV